jgi:transposase
MVLLVAAQGLTVAQIAARVREREATVRRWRTRSLAAGLDGLHDAPRPGRPSAVTEATRAARLAAVRRRPRSVGLPCSRWTLHVWSMTWPSTRVCGARMRRSGAP